MLALLLQHDEGCVLLTCAVKQQEFHAANAIATFLMLMFQICAAG